MKRLAIACGALWLGLGGHAQAYPIPPETLWRLTEQADVVVLATVMRRETRQLGAKDDWERDTAFLQIKEVWKGRAPREVRVAYEGGLLCPAPARFEPLLDVLAFLSKKSEAAPYRVVGLSYGTLYPEVNEVPVFRRLVKEALAAQGRSADPATRTDWLVSAAEEPATRWHGLYELDSAADPMHQHYDDGERKAGVTLTEAQVQRLMRAFVEKPRLDRNLPMLLKVLGKRPSAEVDQTAVAAIDTLLDTVDPPPWTGELIALTKARLGLKPRPAPKKHARDLVEALDDPLLSPMAVDNAVLRRDWDTVRGKLPFPGKRLPWPVRPAVRGVGAESPP
jgi:hypothetical protein